MERGVLTNLFQGQSKLSMSKAGLPFPLASGGEIDRLSELDLRGGAELNALEPPSLMHHLASSRLYVRRISRWSLRCFAQE